MAILEKIIALNFNLSHYALQYVFRTAKIDVILGHQNIHLPGVSAPDGTTLSRFGEARARVQFDFFFRTTRWPSHTRIMGALQDPYTLGQRVVREQKLPAAGPSGPPTIRLESCPDMCMCPINYLHIKNYPSTLYFFEMDQCHFVNISWGQVTCLFKSNLI